MALNTTELSYNATPISSECPVLQAREFIPWNHPDNLISFQTEQLVKKFRFLVFLPLTFLIGVPANIINMVVFYRHGLKERINVCLFALSLADGIYLIMIMVTSAEHVYTLAATTLFTGAYFAWITNHNLLGFLAFRWVSQILSAIIASERCFCVLQPLKSQTILHTSTMTGIIIVVFIVITGCRFIVTTRFIFVCAYDAARDRIIMVSGVREFYSKHKKLVDLLDIIVYSSGIPFVVIVVVMVTTIITVIKLRQAAEWRTGTSSSSGSVSARDIALTRMLVGNSIFFMVCTLPLVLFGILLLAVPGFNLATRYHNFFTTIMWLNEIFSLINSTFNIVVYYSMGSRYRHTVYSLLGRQTTKDTSY